MEKTEMRTRLALVFVLIPTLLFALAFTAGCTSSGETAVGEEFAGWNQHHFGTVLASDGFGSIGCAKGQQKGNT